MMTVFNVATAKPAAIAVSAREIGNAIGRARSKTAAAAQRTVRTTAAHKIGSRGREIKDDASSKSHRQPRHQAPWCGFGRCPIADLFGDHVGVFRPNTGP